VRETLLIESSPGSLREGFGTRFQVLAAVSDTLRNEVFRIRHQVYCEDLQFEPHRPDRYENDQYDAHSLHLLLRHIGTREYIACARVIRANPDNPESPLPFELVCGDTLHLGLVGARLAQRQDIGEVSRLAVIGKYRRRKGESSRPYGLGESDFGGQAQSRFPYILIGMYLGVMAISVLHHIKTLFVLTEPRLRQHFARLGIGIQQAGEPVAHRGVLVPSMIETLQVVAGFNRFVQPLYQQVFDDVQRDLLKAH